MSEAAPELGDARELFLEEWRHLKSSFTCIVAQSLQRTVGVSGGNQIIYS